MMSENDLRTALQFAPEKPKDRCYLHLSYDSHKQTPYVRRLIREVMGVADHSNEFDMRYGNLVLVLHPLDKHSNAPDSWYIDLECNDPLDFIHFEYDPALGCALCELDHIDLDNMMRRNA